MLRVGIQILFLEFFENLFANKILGEFELNESFGKLIVFQIFLSCSQLHLQRKTVKHTVKLFSLSDPLTPSKLKFGHCISSKINQRISKVYTVSDQEAFTVCCNRLLQALSPYCFLIMANWQCY